MNVDMQYHLGMKNRSSVKYCYYYISILPAETTQSSVMAKALTSWECCALVLDLTHIFQSLSMVAGMNSNWVRLGSIPELNTESPALLTQTHRTSALWLCTAYRVKDTDSL